MCSNQKRCTTGKFINLTAKVCYLPNLFVVMREIWSLKREKLFQVTVNKKYPILPKKTYGIHCNLFITPKENFTTFSIENPVCEIVTHIFLQDKCTYLLLDYT